MNHRLRYLHQHPRDPRAAKPLLLPHEAICSCGKKIYGRTYDDARVKWVAHSDEEAGVCEHGRHSSEHCRECKGGHGEKA